MIDTDREEHQDAGKSSFQLIDSTKFFGELGLKKGSTFLDVGCGRGQYSIAASEIIGDEGLVYAIDIWKEGITNLKEKILAKKINNINTMVDDISKKIPIDNDSVDVCLMANVLHGFVQEAAEKTFREITRVLNAQGVLAIIEFKKIDNLPGPPIKIRLAPEEIEEIANLFGFRKKQVVEVGAYNYLITFSKEIT